MLNIEAIKKSKWVKNEWIFIEKTENDKIFCLTKSSGSYFGNKLKNKKKKKLKSNFVNTFKNSSF